MYATWIDDEKITLFGWAGFLEQPDMSKFIA